MVTEAVHQIKQMNQTKTFPVIIIGTTQNLWETTRATCRVNKTEGGFAASAPTADNNRKPQVFLQLKTLWMTPASRRDCKPKTTPISKKLRRPHNV